MLPTKFQFILYDLQAMPLKVFWQIQIQILYWYVIQQRIVISNNTINRHTQNIKQLKTRSSTRAEEAKSHNELITNTI
jgi:hypothetical protein